MRARIDTSAPLRAVVAVSGQSTHRGNGGVLELECGHRALWRKHLYRDAPPKRAKCETCLMVAKGLLPRAIS